MTKRVLLYFALLLWFVVPVTAQPTIFVEDSSADPLENITADVKVSGFSEIAGMQFSVNWDATVLQFDSVSINSVDGLPDYFYPGNIGTQVSNEGKLTTLWFDQGQTGVTLNDNISLFTIYFSVIGDPGDNTEISITGDPTIIEVVDINSQVLEVTTESGTITVIDPTGIEDVFPQSNPIFTLYQNEPNPFENQTVIRFDVQEPSDFVLEVYDLKGSIIYTENTHYFEGNHAITIKDEILPAAGTYLYKLKTKDYFITNRMILVRK